MLLVNLILICLIFSINAKYIAGPDDETLELVQVLFRHGDRTNDPASLYPNDPYRNETYFPYGVGQLTIAGKRREYMLGKLLRQRYSDFLSDIYYPGVVEAISSNVNRTKASLLLVLAGLFPPSDLGIFDNSLNWQPIPYNYLPTDQDPYFLSIYCTKFMKLLDEYMQSPKIKFELNKDKIIFDYLSENTGWKVENYFQTFLIYGGLKTEEELGFELPEWTKSVYPEYLMELNFKFYRTYTGSTDLRKMVSGFLLKKIVDNSVAKMMGNLDDTQIVLYSGHEFNIAFMLETLNIFDKHVPPYGAHLMFELHKIDGVHGLKIYYQNYMSKEPKLFQIPGCTTFCPLNKFISLVEENFPGDLKCQV